MGILVADVVDKGVGAALYMVLCWSLIRTYAAEFPDEPECVLRTVNHRILADTSANQFVTIFYGVLDPVTGSLVYCNAGQWPPHLFIGGKNGTTKRLTRTALPLGILEDAGCGRGVVELDPGDVLVLYTDGITEAQDDAEALYGEERLMATAIAHLGGSAQAIRDAIIEDVRAFIGDAPQFDDIALAVLVREPAVG